MLARSVIDEARVHLHDERGPAFRYTDEQLLEYLNNFQAEALRVRPDMFIGTSFAAPTLAIEDTLTVDGQFKDAAVYFVVGHAMLREDEFSDDGRAVSLIQKATLQLTTALA